MQDMAKQHLTVKLRLRDKHATELNRQSKAVNFVWNYCNETSRKAWDRDRKWLSRFDLHKLTSGTSADLGILSATINRVCDAFTKARGEAHRASVRWRGRKSLGWVPFKTGNVQFDGRALSFRGAIYEPMHLNPRLEPGATIIAGSFNQNSRGHWYVNLSIRVDCADRASISRIGVDLGLKELATLSDGTKIPMPSFYRKSELALATAQRARKTKRVRSIHAKVANRRSDFLHKVSSALSKKHGLIVIGDVSPSKLAQTRRAKSVLDAGWSDLKHMLSYKALMHGGSMLEVSERQTTQTCSSCGSLPPSRPRGIAGLGIREWACDDCGTIHDRDVNAARNILRVGLDALAEGAAL
jgi:IS605 OrfB family transposase